jgi:hypothetical protein
MARGCSQGPQSHTACEEGTNGRFKFSIGGVHEKWRLIEALIKIIQLSSTQAFTILEPQVANILRSNF